ncbi:hypothetical protein ABZQ47_31480, partial [Pseudomonas aeruginosa]
ITEQLVLFEVESTHRLGLASAEEDGRHFARATRALAFFNGLLGKLHDLAGTRNHGTAFSPARQRGCPNTRQKRQSPRNARHSRGFAHM